MLPRHPGKCSRLHGHSWTGHVTIIGDVNPSTGFVMDYYHLGEIIRKRIFDPLDHKHLGVHYSTVGAKEEFLVPDTWRAPIDFYPSSERLLRWIVQMLKVDLPNLYEVVLHETCTSAAIWTLNDVTEPDYGSGIHMDAFDR